MEPIIKVDNVSMCFNLSTEKHESLKEYLLAMVQGRLQYDEFYALRDVSLDIMPGDFYGLVGLNGSGKSTLLKTIAGVYKPTKGKVTVNGTIAPLIELGAGFDMDLTARENIYLNGTSCIRFSHFCWKRKSPTDSTSSAMRMSGLVMVAMAKPMRATMPEE